MNEVENPGASLLQENVIWLQRSHSLQLSYWFLALFPLIAVCGNAEENVKGLSIMCLIY